MTHLILSIVLSSTLTLDRCGHHKTTIQIETWHLLMADTPAYDDPLCTST